MNTTKQTFQKIPVNLIDAKANPKEAYMYAKLSMLENVNYCQTALGTNPVSGLKEMERDTVSKAIRGLSEKGLVNISKKRLPDHSYDSNVYELTTFEGYFKGVYNDFINLGVLDANTKGFAILLHLLGYVPSSYKQMAEATGVSDKSCKKYAETLKEFGIIENGKLNTKFFPRLEADAAKKEFEEKLKELTSITYNDKTQAYVNRCADNLIKQLEEEKITYKFAIERLTAIAAGLYWIKKDNNETTETITL